MQRDVVARQFAVARQAKKPLVLHIRNGQGKDGEPVDAFSAAIYMLQAEQARDIGGVFHCFTGSVAEAKRALDLGFYLSIPGVITFKNPGALIEVVKMAPGDRLVVETDAPYMAPVPHRGKRNEPAFVTHTAECVAAARGEDRLAFLQTSGQNARRLFPALQQLRS